jgi:hypothetical protein
MSGPKCIDMRGMKFGMLSVLELYEYSADSPYQKSQPTRWHCSCDCGNKVVAIAAALRSGRTTNCGRKSHPIRRGRRWTKAYSSWSSMLNRCNNPKNIGYAKYGGRGVAVCDRWLKFENFLADMGEPPQGKTLDRYPDVNGNYEKSNCRWATPKEQARNRRSTRMFSINGVERSLPEWCEIFEQPYGAVQGRVRMGLDVEAALLAVDIGHGRGKMGVQLISLRNWAQALFGEQMPHRHTLRNWVNGGKIRPMPIKMGRSYFCRPDAQYVGPNADEINGMANGSKTA